MFTAQSFEANFELFRWPDGSDIEKLTIPSQRKISDFKQYVDDLPNIESPLWSGLPVNVEKILRANQANQMITLFKGLQDIEEAISLSPPKANAKGKQEGEWA